MKGQGELFQRLSKRCPKCRLHLPREAFAKARNMPDGLQGWCRDCYAENYRRRRGAQGNPVRKKVAVPAGYKHCYSCNTSRPLSEWHTNKSSLDGYASYCKSCLTLRGRESYFWRKYGLSQSDLAALLEEQRGSCAICFGLDPKHVDHDHETGKVRGLLCFNCNVAIGHLRDRPDILRRAAAYLEGDQWKVTKLAPGVFQLPSWSREARPSPTLSPDTLPSCYLVDVARPQPQ